MTSIKKERALLNKVYRDYAVHAAMTVESESEDGINYVDLDSEPFNEELVDAGLTDVLAYIKEIDGGR